MVQYKARMKRIISHDINSFAEAISIAKISSDDNEAKTSQTVSINVSTSNNGNSSSTSSSSSSIY